MAFPPTSWELIAELNDGDPACRSAALTEIVETYSAPLLALARMEFPRKQPQDYEEMLQEFFSQCWQKGSLGKADRTKGRFRNWLITCFKHAVINGGRKATWGRTSNTSQKAHPNEPIVSVDALLDTYGPLMEPRANDTPETLAERVYLIGIRDKALRDLRTKCEAGDRIRRYEVFRARYITPLHDALKGATHFPRLSELTSQFGFPSEEQCKRVLKSSLDEFRSAATELLARDGSTPEEARGECELICQQFLAN